MVPAMQGPLHVTDTVFESRQSTTRAERIILFAGGLFCFLPLWDFFIRPGGNPFQIGLLPFWIIAIGGVSIALPLLWGAIAGGETVTCFDAGSGLLTLAAAGPFSRKRESFAFDRIERIEVVENTSSDGPSSFDLVAGLAGRPRPLVVRNFTRAADAETACGQVRTIIENGLSRR